MSKIFIASDNTQFKIDDGWVSIGHMGGEYVHVALATILEFAASIEREQTKPEQTKPDRERTKLVAMMAATIAAGVRASGDGWSGAEVVDCATMILAAVEEQGK